jgi:hypothetical protein
MMAALVGFVIAAVFFAAISPPDCVVPRRASSKA